MEFRCRLASPNGEIIEGVYAADNEARLRHELEDKGLYVLSLQPKGSIAGLALRLPQRHSVASVRAICEVANFAATGPSTGRRSTR